MHMDFLPRAKREGGQSLIEAMVGTTLVLVGILGMIGLVTRSFAANDVVVNRFIAANLAAEGVEVVKNVIDTKVAAHNETWQQIQDDLSKGPFGVEIGVNGPVIDADLADRKLCFENGGYLYDKSCAGVVTSFKRSVAITSATEISVAVTVSWITRGTPNSLTVDDVFWDWRQ